MTRFSPGIINDADHQLLKKSRIEDRNGEAFWGKGKGLESCNGLTISLCFFREVWA